LTLSAGNASAQAAWSFERDIEDVLRAARPDWLALQGARIFITGGTGLIGRWWLEAMRQADVQLRLGLRATILSRDPRAFARKAPHLANYASFELVQGDVRDFESPTGAFSHVIHAATDASAELNARDPRRMFDTVVKGTRRALDFALEKHPVRTVYLSSGAVYGRQPWDLDLVPETFTGAPDCTDAGATYAEAKRAAEMLCAIYAKQFGLDIVTARIFALLGPHLTLDIHFAAGNFIRDAMAGRPVIVRSSGEACRSYLYLSELIIWLTRIMVGAAAGSVYNVGSEEWVSIRDLAARTAQLLARGEFEIRGESDPGWNPGRYAPDTSRIRRDLGVDAKVGLDEAILRTARWNGWKGGA
jgi:nucleoside-diphosphate-sugar epimerase